MKSPFKNRRFLSIALLAFALFFAIPQQVFSQSFPEKPSPPRLVNDFAKIYSATENSSLEEKLVTYGNQTSTQIAIVTLTSLNGYPIDDYTIKLANKWQIGQKGKNNGLLILIAKDDHKIQIASGYGMEGVLNDGKLGTIIRSKIIPQFKTGNYYAGTNDGVDAIIAAAAGEYVNDESDNTKRDAPFFAQVFAFLILFFVMIFFFHIHFIGGGGVPIIYSSGRSSGSGGGGFGGFGGGGFGGGGAGGSW